MINFEPLPLVFVILIFALASGVVWFAGTRLSRYADALAKKTGTADVIVGTLLLGGVTSLPEIVTTITASAEGDAKIAINNLFGGVALQVTILAVGDFFVKKRSITSLIGSPVVQLQAVVGILLLVLSAAIVMIGDVALGPLSIGSILIFAFFVAGFYLINYFQSIHWWRSDPEKRDTVTKVKELMSRQHEEDSALDQEEAREEAEDMNEEQEQRSAAIAVRKTRLVIYIILSAMAILVAGYTVVQTGQAMSSKTGLGSSLVGAILIALATSLPEVSTTIASVRIKEYRLAFSNIFGTNIFTVAFVCIADIFYKEGPILNEVDRFSIFGAMLGSLLTTLYIIGLSVRLKKTIFHLGYDSLIVTLAYLFGVYAMFSILSQTS